MKTYIPSAMLFFFLAGPAVAVSDQTAGLKAPDSFFPIISVQKVISKVVASGKYGNDPSHSSISFKDGRKTIHFTVYHHKNVAYRFAVIIIEPTADENFIHTSLVDLIENAHQSLDGFIELFSKDELVVTDSCVEAIHSIRMAPKTAQKMFERALIQFSLWLNDGTGTFALQ